MSSEKPIGVLDSGLGGLSVLRALVAKLPHEHFLYCSDNDNAPWGDKDADYIIGRTQAMVAFLVGHGAKAVVLACNTATAVAADTLRREFSLPIIGIEPAVKPAAKLSPSGRFGVLGTTRTITSERYHSLLVRFTQGTHVMSVAAPGLMECVERGEFDTPKTKALLKKYLTPMLDAGIDTLVLACTHYPFLEKAIYEVAARPLTIIEPSRAVADVLATRLKENNLLNEGSESVPVHFWIKGAKRFTPALKTLWPKASTIEELTV